MYTTKSKPSPVDLLGAVVRVRERHIYIGNDQGRQGSTQGMAYTEGTDRPPQRFTGIFWRGCCQYPYQLAHLDDLEGPFSESPFPDSNSYVLLLVPIANTARRYHRVSV